VQPGRLSDLSETLARATSIVDDLGTVRGAVAVEDRPGFLVTQPGNDPEPIIERLASAQRLTFLVGAGASMEAGLPSWGRLVRAVLESLAPASLDESDRACPALRPTSVSQEAGPRRLGVWLTDAAASALGKGAAAELTP
jgi:hypothetical protein